MWFLPSVSFLARHSEFMAFPSQEASLKRKEILSSNSCISFSILLGSRDILFKSLPSLNCLKLFSFFILLLFVLHGLFNAFFHFFHNFRFVFVANNNTIKNILKMIFLHKVSLRFFSYDNSQYSVCNAL